MRIYLDSADLDEIEKAKGYSIIAGVTTNPALILAGVKTGSIKGKRDKDILAAILAKTEGLVFFQVRSGASEEIFERALEYCKLDSKRVVIKLPCTWAGLKTVPLLKGEGIKTCVTAVFTGAQACLAAEAGADFLAFYLSRFEKAGEDGVKRLASLVKMVGSMSNSNTKVISASIKVMEDAVKSILVGVDHVAVPLNVLEAMIEHPLTQHALEQFARDWREYDRLLNLYKGE